MSAKNAPEKIYIPTADFDELLDGEVEEMETTIGTARGPEETEYVRADLVPRWIPIEEGLPQEMDFYLCRMDDEPDMGPRMDVVFYAIRGPGSMAVKETGWAEPVLYKWANPKVTHWLSNVPPIQNTEER